MTDRALLRRLAGWLERPEIRAHDPARLAALAAVLEERDPPVIATRHGGLVCYDPAPGRRRLLAFDRSGHLMQALRWEADGGLRWAKCRTAGGGWIGVEPGAATHPAWGRSDRVWLLRGGEPWEAERALTVFQSVDWALPDFIPPLAEPARLPAGAGTALLNLLSGLMKDQGRPAVRYRGPYPSESLFTALLESFRYDPRAAAPLERFLDEGDLDWLPAPFEAHLAAPGVWVQLRHEVEKVVLGGMAFYRPDWQGVRRREPRVVRFEGDRVICSLWALGQSVEDRLVLSASGEVLERPAPAASGGAPAPLAPVWTSALADLIARESAPALGGAIREVLEALTLEWGPVPGDLLRVEGSTIRLSDRLRRLGLDTIRAASPGDGRGERAVLFALEIARLLAPEVRLRAQRRLEALPEAEQRRLLEESDP